MKTWQKTNGKGFKSVETKAVEHHFDVDDLKEEKQRLKSRIDEINLLLDAAKTVGLEAETEVPPNG